MPARLTIFPPHRPSSIWPLREEHHYVIGRDPAVEIVVDDDRISRRHAEIVSDDGWRLRDLGSKNGVEIEGRLVESEGLDAETWLSLGGVLARFQQVEEDQVAAEAGRTSRKWRTSAELQRRLDPSLGVEVLLERLLDSVLELSGAERGFILLRRAGGDDRDDSDDSDGDADLEIAAARGPAAADLRDEAQRDRTFPGSSGVVRRVMDSRRPTATNDAAAETWLGGRASVLAGGIRALVCLPLVADARALGVVYADSREPGAMITTLDLEVLEALAEHAALALSLARMDRELAALAALLERDEGSSSDVALRLTRLRPGRS